MKDSLLTSCVVVALALAGCGEQEVGKYGPGVSDTEIKLGNTMPYSGPASAIGSIGRTISAYCDKVNASGGINGRMVRFISLDDGYNPPKTVEQTRKLIERDEVVMTFQSLGTPTNSAIHKYMNAKKVPFTQEDPWRIFQA